MENIDVFLSYHSGTSAPLAQTVVARLEERGINCWFAPRNIDQEDYTGSIVSAIKRCSVFVILLNKEASESQHILNEISIATQRQRYDDSISIIPFCIDNGDISAAARFHLGRMHWVDGVTPSISKRIDELADRISAILKKNQVPDDAETKPIAQVKPYAGADPFVFVSYSHRNTDRVIEVIRKLQEKGYRVWYDEGIDPGTEWDDFIAEQIENCGYMIAFISKEYLESDNCKDELNFARDLNKKRLLVYLEDVALPRGMAMRLNRLQAIHLYKYASLDLFMEKFHSADGLEEFRS